MISTLFTTSAPEWPASASKATEPEAMPANTLTTTSTRLTKSPSNGAQNAMAKRSAAVSDLSGKAGSFAERAGVAEEVCGSCGDVTLDSSSFIAVLSPDYRKSEAECQATAKKTNFFFNKKGNKRTGKNCFKWAATMLP